MFGRRMLLVGLLVGPTIFLIKKIANKFAGIEKRLNDMDFLLKTHQESLAATVEILKKLSKRK